MNKTEDRATPARWSLRGPSQKVRNITALVASGALDTTTARACMAAARNVLGAAKLCLLAEKTGVYTDFITRDSHVNKESVKEYRSVLKDPRAAIKKRTHGA